MRYEAKFTETVDDVLRGYRMAQSYCFFIPARAFVDGYFPLQELKSFLASKKNRLTFER
jgi:hypothetical protein